MVATFSRGAEDIFLGRPWRPYSTVLFLNTMLDARIVPAGWREWHPGDTHSRETSFYAEFNSNGMGASPHLRDPHAKQLSRADANQYSIREFLARNDHWNPKKIK
jgi:pectin methylesterase-like acyl-CoA thioesterase